MTLCKQKNEETSKELLRATKLIAFQSLSGAQLAKVKCFC